MKMSVKSMKEMEKMKEEGRMEMLTKKRSGKACA
jgi:hypothetical protein